MNDREQIRQLLYQFESAGLVEKNIKKIRNCFARCLLGIGIGEQGFVTSFQEVERIFLSGLKSDDTATHTVTFRRIEILQPAENFAFVCAEVQVNYTRPEDGKSMKSQFQQSLTVLREEEKWKICGLHASSPTVTEEDIEAYPLKFAEKTLASLREKIGEEVYLTEEQYRRAVLADTIAFYIINFTTDCFEKCQLQSEVCIFVASGTPYEKFILENAACHVFDEDLANFLQCLSLKNIRKAFRTNNNEVSCEYRMKLLDGTYAWTRTIVRLIRDVVSGDLKGIMYVKNIDEEKREALKIREKANYDAMTNTLHKGAMRREVDQHIRQNAVLSGGVFLMIDVDNFKQVNDTFGHPVGDRVLIAIAEILRKSFGISAQIARLGGDEFGVYLPSKSLDQGTKDSVDQLLHTVRQFRLPEIPQLRLSLSIGGVFLPAGNFDTLYSAADEALYRVKRSGKNGICWIDESMSCV